ncbi:derlin-1-like [Hydractinia symbiolongicarpus]|uniref:derlin-1-like n=1 Tax=Hydractinia symbiolongicarpus TaxID=13093 RepID=UPI0025513C15|nr:derlin-1-like [Hydractinia symbiolongicarpus]
MPDSDIGDWFRSIPIITRWWFGLSIVFPLLGRIGLLNPYYMILDFSLVAYKFQIWRLFTSIVYFPLSPNTGFHYLINLYFLYNYSTRLESGVFDGRPADYLFLLIFNTISLIFLGFAMKLMLLMDALILSVLYIWCQINKDQIVQFWFGTQFKAMYLPWVLAAFNMILGQGGVMEITGIFVGHLYFFLMFKYPQDFGGRRLLSTPSILYNYLPNRRGGVSGFGQAPQARRQPDGRGGFPGGGQRLGDN